MKKNIVITMAALLASTVMAQEPGTQPTQPTLAAPVRADSVGELSTTSPSQEEMQALRQEISRLRGEVEELRARRPNDPVRAESAPQAELRAPIAEPAPQVTQVAPREVAPREVAPAVVQMPASGAVQVSKVNVSSTRRLGTPGISVSADVALRGVANVPFTMQALLVTPDEQVHTDARSNPYIVAREISTGDDEDTDDYAVFMDLGNLFSSRPPQDLFVQVRILDLRGNLVAKSGLHTFRRPWQ